MKTLLLVAMLATFFGPTNVVTADLPRSCSGSVPGAPCADFWIYDTVFIGTVKKLVNEPFGEGLRPDYQEYRKVTATLTVDEAFRGKLGTEVVFEMTSCYYEFRQGEKYLVYTNKGQDGKFQLFRRYSRTRPLAEAGEDLDFIRSLPTAPPGGRIFGDVGEYRNSPTLRLNNEPDPFIAQLAGVAIHVRSGEKAYQTISDATGHYEFTGLPPGTYELSTNLPDFLGGTRHTFKVVDKACVNVNLPVHSTGYIKGRLISADGEPIEKAVVSIFSADGVTEDMFDRVRPYYMKRSETDKDGSFRFERLQSGRYHLAVNMLAEERRKESRAADYPRIFYPAVRSFKDAKPITLADGAKLENIEIRLSQPTPRSTPTP